MNFMFPDSFLWDVIAILHERRSACYITQHAKYNYLTFKQKGVTYVDKMWVFRESEKLNTAWKRLVHSECVTVWAEASNLL